MILGNETTILKFILLGFGELPKFQIFFFLLFLIIYVVTVTGNILILAVVVFDHHLRTPMYFFLGNLSFLEVCYTSNIFPRLLMALVTGHGTISYSHCITQWYLFGSLEATECCLLCVMSFDRYLAICRPLHYATTMNTWTCIQLSTASWINGFVGFSMLLVLMLQLTFCGPSEMDHYFCDYFPLLRLSCSDTNLLEIMSYVVAVIFTFPPFLLTLTSYIYIIAAILRISSTTGRQKAFSTCSSHLVVVSIFYGSLMIVYMLPKHEVTHDVQTFSSLLYTLLPPLANPFIYSLRNKEVKQSIQYHIGRLVSYKTNSIVLVNVVNV